MESSQAALPNSMPTAEGAKDSSRQRSLLADINRLGEYGYAIVIPGNYQALDPRKKAFHRQKEAFLARAKREPIFLSPYQGKFVVSLDGEIVDSDKDLPTLTLRFFSHNKDVSVYITQIKPAPPEQLLTPFF